MFEHSIFGAMAGGIGLDLVISMVVNLDSLNMEASYRIDIGVFCDV